MKKRSTAVVLVCCLLLLGIFLARMFRAGARRIPSKEELLAGEQMYRTALLPSGASMKAAVGAGKSFYFNRDLPNNPVQQGPLLWYFVIGYQF